MGRTFPRLRLSSAAESATTPRFRAGENAFFVDQIEEAERKTANSELPEALK